MKILVVGSGGREHALAWKLAQSKRIQIVMVAPGNGGTASDPRLKNVPITDPKQLADFAEQEHIALTVVGPEAPLAAGIVDLFRERGLKIFGPTQRAAQLEASKDFAKSFMQRHGIPTAHSQTFVDVAAAHQYVDQQGAPIVIKADGLAAGKGVVVAMSLDEAHQAIDMMPARASSLRNFSRVKKRVSSLWSMVAMCCHSLPARTINAYWTMIRGRTLVAWARTHLRPSLHRNSMRG